MANFGVHEVRRAVARFDLIDVPENLCFPGERIAAVEGGLAAWDKKWSVGGIIHTPVNKQGGMVE